MSYNRKTWTNRNSEHPYRRTLTDTTSGTTQTVDVTRAEGTVTTEGDTFDANTMNNMEGRIADQFSAVDQRTGALTDLTTTDKSSLVAAINEVNAGGGGGGSSTLAGLTDTDISSPTNGQVLKYNSTSSKWENAAESGSGTAKQIIITCDLTHHSLGSILDQDNNTIAMSSLYSYVKDGANVILVDSSSSSSTSLNENDILFLSMIKGSVSSVDNSEHIEYRFTKFYLANLVNYVILDYDITNDTTDVGSLMSTTAASTSSPSFTGNPTAPTQEAGNNSTRIATTAFVQGEKPSVGSITNLTTVSANTSSWQNVGSFATAKGSKYLIVIIAEFAGNSTGVRQIGISTTSGGTPMDFFRTVGANNMGTVKQQLQLVSILAPSSNTTYYINVAQNSGSGLEIKSKYSLIKLA